MNRPSQPVSYRALFRLPGIPSAFTAATLGRLSYATLSLSLLVSIQHATGSYADAGTALGAYAIASIAMPAKSRMVDRYGQRRVLPPLSAGFALALIAVAVAVASSATTVAVFVVLSAVAGLTAPPLGPSMRARWAMLTPQPEARQRAYSLDGVVEEVLFAAGPLVASLILILANGSTALIVTAALNLVGTLAMATCPVEARPTTPTTATRSTRRLLGPLHQRGFALLALVMLGIGLGGGPLEVAVIARTQDQGNPGASGYLLAALAIGSALGGLVWGHYRHHHQVSTQLGTWILIAAAGTAVAAITPTLILLAIALAITGAVNAPAIIVAYLAADDLVPKDLRTEATTWVNTSCNIGVALGAAIAGIVIDNAHPGTALITGALILALTAALAFTTRARLGASGNRDTRANPPMTGTQTQQNAP